MGLRYMAAALALLAGPVGAADFNPLGGAGIGAALTGKTFSYADGARQVFYESGRTLYEHGRPSWGYWEVRGDQYCSQWPPAAGWACYDVTSDGTAVRFQGDSGTVYEAVPAP